MVLGVAVEVAVGVVVLEVVVLEVEAGVLILEVEVEVFDMIVQLVEVDVEGLVEILVRSLRLVAVDGLLVVEDIEAIEGLGGVLLSR